MSKGNMRRILDKLNEAINPARHSERIYEHDKNHAVEQVLKAFKINADVGTGSYLTFDDNNMYLHINVDNHSSILIGSFHARVLENSFGFMGVRVPNTLIFKVGAS